MYKGMGNHFLILSFAANSFLFFGSVYLKKYQDESTNVSIVSVSLSAGPLHLGHFTLTHFSALANGDLPPSTGKKSASLGSFTGSSVSGTRSEEHTSELQSQS